MFKAKALFFDLDGTLVDARRDIAAAMNRVLQRLGYPERSVDAITSYIGTGVKDLVADSIGTADASLIDRATVMYEEEYLKAPADHTIIFPGVVETLDFFKDKDKYILTNRYAHLASALLEKVGIKKYFKEVYGGDKEGCIKPSICVTDIIFKKLKLDKKDAIMIGDMSIDVMTGKNSGIKSCWVTYGLGKREEVMPLEPDYVLDSIFDLTKIIT